MPHSLEAERVVLGGLMLDPNRVESMTEFVSVEDFYSESHGHLYELMQQMAEAGRPTEMLAVIERIAAAGEEDRYGGLAYVSSLPDQVPSTENLAYYAGRVRERAIQRRLIEGAREIQTRALSGSDEIPELMDFAESTVFQVTQATDASDWSTLSTVVDTEFLRIQELSENRGEVTGIPTGFIDLDRILAGLHRSDLLVLAARPAMGKTALALNIGQNAALNRDKPTGVGIFSLEMARGQLATRMLCSQARVDAGKVRTGFLSRQHDFPRLTRAAEDLYQIPFFIDDTPAPTISQIRSKSRRLKSKCPELGVIIVDYIGLIQGDNRISREQQVSASSRGLKALAKEIDVAVIALSQLNRSVEQRPNKRPIPSDLRESGAIEQDADVIMFIYRDEYYNKENSPEPGVAEVIVAKQRNGPTGTAKLAFQGQFTRFENLAHHMDDGGYV